METTMTFTTDELVMLSAAMTNLSKSLYAVANRVGPAAREGREARIERSNAAHQLAERIRDAYHEHTTKLARS